MEKGEIAHFEQFHLFPQCFPNKSFFLSVLKRVYMEKRVDILYSDDQYRAFIIPLFNKQQTQRLAVKADRSYRKLQEK